MEIDSSPPIPPKTGDMSKVLEAINSAMGRMLDPISETVRDEIRRAITQERSDEQMPQGNDFAVEFSKLHNQLDEVKAERNSLRDVVRQSNEKIAQAERAVHDLESRNKKLHGVIIESSQNMAPPMDEDIVMLFNHLNHDIMKIVKKHFTFQLRPAESDKPLCKSLRPLSAENRELWVRGWIAEMLYNSFFVKDKRVFGLDEKREGAMREFEFILQDSGRVSKRDIDDWRIRTVSCARKLNIDGKLRRCGEISYDIVRDLRPIGPPKGSEQDEAEQTMVGICSAALNIATLFRSNTVTYTWLQKKKPSSIAESESEIIGSTAPGRPAEGCTPWRIVFGGVVKNDQSEDRLVLTKSELLVK